VLPQTGLDLPTNFAPSMNLRSENEIRFRIEVKPTMHCRPNEPSMHFCVPSFLHWCRSGCAIRRS
jgi:hypothetical protein